MNDFPARAVVDLAAVRQNVRSLAAHAPTAQVMAVVKADAYGHGLVPSASAAVAGGATWLGVAQVDEALELRRAGLTGARVLAWLYTPGAPLREAVEADVDLAVAAPWALDAVAAAARAAGRTARLHLKVDTGLGRNGLVPTQLPDVLARARALEAEGVVDVVGVFSHLALADDPGSPVVRRQAVGFAEAVAAVEAAGVRLEVRHLANAAATLTDPALHWDVVRPGIAVYGLSPVPQVGGPDAFGLVPAMTYEAELATVKAVPAGTGVSYGHQYVVPHDTVLGIVPVGYADGVPRHASGTQDRPGGPMQVGGRRLGVAGRVCMDQVVVDLGPGAREAAGDRVVLFGPGTDGEPTAQDWAEAAGTISYEIVTRVGARVPRTYVDPERATAVPTADAARASVAVPAGGLA